MSSAHVVRYGEKMNHLARKLKQHYIALPFSRSLVSDVIHLVKENRNIWLLAIPVTTFCLGTWQVLRIQQKITLMEDLEKRTLVPVINIPENVSDRLDELNYRHVCLSGHFDHTQEIHMWPRKLVSKFPSSNNQETGAIIITPFYCNETQSRILVNRGWVPTERMDPTSRPHGQVTDEITFKGFIRIQDKKPVFSPKNDIVANKWSWRDVQAMANHLGTQPIFIDADHNSTVHGGPIGGQTKVTVPNDNLQYIVTWHAFSLATFYVIWRYWKRR